MPRLTISIVAPSDPHDGNIFTLEVPDDLTIGGLKDLVQAEVHIHPTTQNFYFNGRAAKDDNQTLAGLGIGDGDMIAMVQRSAQEQAQPRPATSQQPRRPQNQTNGGARRNVPSDPNSIEDIRRRMLSDPAAVSQLRTQQPALFDALQDPARFRAVWQEMARADQQRENDRMDELALLNNDPMNIDTQLRIEEIIRQQQVMENLEFAYTHSPEVFARVTMLYIPVTVNSYPVKAFVDSGAQTTIMSPSCAESCGIMRLIDRRYSGIAKGVGTAQILGRVHAADITIGLSTMSCSFTVMEGKDVDLLLGLDMLKRFQAIIDLKQNKLIFGPGNDVEFLGEADIPKHMDDAQQSEPTVAGPDGTEIGAKSGTVKPAGTSSAAAASASGSGATAANSAANTFQGPGRTLGGSSSNASTVQTSSRPGATSSSRPTGTAGGAASTQPRYPADIIQQLTTLGFSEAQAIQALDACDGNVEYAAGLLFGS